MTTSASVTLTVLVATKVYVSVSPATPLPEVTTPVFSRPIAGVGLNGTVVPPGGVNGGPLGGVPVPVAEFATEPASTSACKIVYVAVPVTLSPGNNVPVLVGQTGKLIADNPTMGSVTATEVNVTVPVFASTNVYVIVSPATPVPEVTAPVFTRVMPLVTTRGTVSGSVSDTSASLGSV